MIALALAFALLAPAPPVVGAPAPRFTLKVHNPKTAGVDRLASRLLVEQKRPLVIDFVASWCAPCRAAIPTLKTLAAAHPEVTIAVVITDEAAEGQSAMLALLADFPGPVLLDPHRLLARRYGVEALPHTALIDATGALRWVGQGEAAGGLADALKAPTQ